MLCVLDAWQLQSYELLKSERFGRLLLQCGTRLLVSVRRVLISISSGCPYQDIFAMAYRCLQTLPHPG